MDTLSTYAKNFMGILEKPEVESITGLSPIIAIEQKTTGNNPRPTVGTITEIYDFLRLLYAKASTAYSPHTGKPMIRYTDEQIVSLIMENYEDRKCYLLAPVVRGRKGHYKELLEQMRKRGYTQVRVDGEICELADLGVLPAPETSTWGLVGQHQGWSLTSAKITKMFKEDVNLFVVKNIKLQSTGFKFTEVTNTDWNKTFGTHDGGNYNNVGYWYAGIYTNNRDNKDKDIKVSNYSKTYDIYLRFVQDASWGKELGFVVVDAGKNYPTY